MGVHCTKQSRAEPRVVTTGRFIGPTCSGSVEPKSTVRSPTSWLHPGSTSPTDIACNPTFAARRSSTAILASEYGRHHPRTPGETQQYPRSVPGHRSEFHPDQDRAFWRKPRSQQRADRTLPLRRLSRDRSVTWYPFRITELARSPGACSPTDESCSVLRRDYQIESATVSPKVDDSFFHEVIARKDPGCGCATRTVANLA